MRRADQARGRIEQRREYSNFPQIWMQLKSFAMEIRVPKYFRSRLWHSLKPAYRCLKRQQALISYSLIHSYAAIPPYLAATHAVRVNWGVLPGD